MKYILIILLSTLIFHHTDAQVVVPVHDQGKIGLWRAVYQGKKDCRPEWMFWILPSWRKYRDKNTQNYLHLLPIWYSTYENSVKADEERKYRAEHANEQIHDALDRSLNIQDLKYQPLFSAKISLVLNNIWTIEDAAESDYNEVETYVKQKSQPIISDLSQVLRGLIDQYHGINASYVPDSQKKQHYDKVLDAMNELNGQALHIREKFKAFKKMKELEFLKQGEL